MSLWEFEFLYAGFRDFHQAGDGGGATPPTEEEFYKTDAEFDELIAKAEAQNVK